MTAMMHIDLAPFVVLWAVLAVCVVALVVWRFKIARQEDDTLHVLHGGTTQQTAVAGKLEVIDKWGKILTVVVVGYGVLLGALYIYQVWMQGATTIGG